MRVRRWLSWFLVLTVVATWLVGSGSRAEAAAARHPAVAATGAPGEAFVPLTPARLLDTRTGSQPGAGSTMTVTVNGRGGVPSSGVSAVIVNLTVVGPATAGYAQAWASGTSRPGTSNVNFSAGQTVANQAVVTVGSGGRINAFTSARANLLVDVTGYYPVGGAYHPVTPTRLVDTRTSGRLAPANVQQQVAIAGRAGVPTHGVAAAVLNVTVTGATGAGNLSVEPDNRSHPATSLLNYTAGRTVAAEAITGVAFDGDAFLTPSAGTHLIVDVVGWISSSADYTSLAPVRLADTRDGTGLPKARVPAGGSVSIQIAGRAGVPAHSVTAAQLTVTAVGPAGAGYVIAGPSGPTASGASTLNLATGVTVANSAAVKIGADGRITIRSSAATDVLVDIYGYWTAAATQSCAHPMRMVFDTRLSGPWGAGDPNTVGFRLDGGSGATVDWGGAGTAVPMGTGTAPVISYGADPGYLQFTYAYSGIHIVEVCGSVQHFAMGRYDTTTDTSQAALTQVTSFGDLGLTDLHGAFQMATNLTAVPATLPTGITDLSYAFYAAQHFNQPLAGWDVSRVTSMREMFFGAAIFNQPVGTWDVSHVTDIMGMFSQDTAFNQPVGNWDVSRVTLMNELFLGTSFNQPLAHWDTRNVTQMGDMFAQSPFNQPIGAWNTAQVMGMSGMFFQTHFNQPIAGWQTSNVRDLGSMFSGDTVFNQPIGSWDTSKVVDMSGMFSQDAAFDQSIGNWRISRVQALEGMLDDSGLSTAHYDQLLNGWAAQPVYPLNDLTANGVTYSAAGAAARASLIQRGWNITDGGQV